MSLELSLFRIKESTALLENTMGTDEGQGKGHENSDAHFLLNGLMVSPKSTCWHLNSHDDDVRRWTFRGVPMPLEWSSRELASLQKCCQRTSV